MANSVALKLAEAERERRKRLEKGAQEELDEPTSFMDTAKGAFLYADRLVGEFNEGLMTLLPSAASNKLRELGVGVSEDEREESPGGAMEAGARYSGMAAPFAAGVPAVGARLTTTAARPGIIRSMVNDITAFAMNHPGLYFGGEGAAAFGAGAVGEVAEKAGGTPTQKLAAELVGGMGLGTLATIGPRSFRAAREAVRANLAPFTEEGGMIRAARQTQERAGGPETAAKYAKRLDEVPEGVTPAQWIGDERLMAQEARLLEDNPSLANQVKGELQEARIIAQEAVKDSFGRPRTRQDWERSVLERVTPEGTTIAPAQTDEMLDQAYDSFAPLYESAEGFDISTSGLGGKISQAIYDPNLMVPDDERRIVTRWFNNLSSSIADKIEFDEIPSKVLLQLRSKVRDERRVQFKRGKEDRADLLGALEGEITKRLENGLPPDVKATLQAADSQYRKYKVVENAIFNAGDANLTPDQLSQSIRMGGLTTNSRYARGADEATQELRRVALAGRSTEEVLGDPQRAKLFVRDLSDAEKQAVQADFADVLFNRAKSQATDATEGGVSFVSGRKLMQDVNDNKDVMKALGMTKGDVDRLQKMAREIQTLEKKSPAAVAQLFEDGPATVMQLAAVLAGAKAGQRLAGRGLGSSLVLAQFMSNRARRTLANLTSDEAERLMADAATDPQLYKALLTKSLLERDLKSRAQYLESWLLASAFDKAQDEQEEQQ